jgi:protease-4
MSLESDLLIDRSRLKRRLNFWRGATILAVIVVALIAVARTGAQLGRNHVARVAITGFISDDRKVTNAIRDVATDDSARALLVYIDSPGGAVAGGEALHAAISAVAEKKPVVAVMGGTAASAGYMIAVPATRIFAREGTLTGSIGVILETGEASGLLRMLGISTDAITSGPLKDQPSFVKPMTEQGRAVLHDLVMDMYDQFVTMVATGRKMDPDRVRALADGRAYTGRQALKLGLIDAIGGEKEARDWLASERGIATSVPMRDVRSGGLMERAFGSDPDEAVGWVMKTVLSQWLRLDGALSLWHPDGAHD